MQMMDFKRRANLESYYLPFLSILRRRQTRRVQIVSNSANTRCEHFCIIFQLQRRSGRIILDYWNSSDDFWDSLRSSRSSQSSESFSTWSVQYRKWSPTANDPETANDPQNGPQMILDRKWSLKSTANDPVKTWGMEWILWEWLQKRTDYKKETFFSPLLKKKGRRTLHLWSIYTRRKKKME